MGWTLDGSDNRTGDDEICKEPWRVNERKRNHRNRPIAVDIQYARMCWNP